jgi:ubiquinone/menaquinone biosynthesis C-methylase UbiE
MVAAAQKRVGQHGWGNVAVVLRDVTRDALGSDEFDAAIATFALSAMPDVPAAVQNVHRALRPGGQLFVLDLRFDTTGTFGAVSWLLDRTYRILAGRSGEDVLAALDDTFQTVEGIMQNGVRRPRSRRWPPIMLVIARKRS